MKTVLSRIDKLEKKFGTADGRPQILVVLCRAGWGFGLDEDRCIQILGESGFLPTGPIGLVNLLDVPDLNADELEQYLREHGNELRPNSARRPLGGQPG
jgi:hypothetical protein